MGAGNRLRWSSARWFQWWPPSRPAGQFGSGITMIMLLLATTRLVLADATNQPIFAPASSGPSPRSYFRNHIFNYLANNNEKMPAAADNLIEEKDEGSTAVDHWQPHPPFQQQHHHHTHHHHHHHHQHFDGGGDGDGDSSAGGVSEASELPMSRTRAAIQELNQVLRHIFPVVPHRQAKSSPASSRTTTDMHHSPRSSSSSFGSASAGPEDGKRSQQPLLTMEIMDHPSRLPPSAIDAALVRRRLKQLLERHRNLPAAAPAALTWPRRPPSTAQQPKQAKPMRRPSTAALGKRGPECMRRCILQGLLHPVQCHSLC